jgi:hypothetical protein
LNIWQTVVGLLSPFQSAIKTCHKITGTGIIRASNRIWRRGADSYFVLGFLDTGRAFAVPVAEMNKMAQYMNLTKRGYINHHVNIRLRGKRVFIYINDDCPEFDILHFEI